MPEYDSITAKHYAAWRPPLHRQILAKVFSPSERFQRGLDMGCGTGHSTHALSAYCDEVIGVDPSQQMIDLAEGNDRVRFVTQTDYVVGIDQGFGDGKFDIFTFAGSLHYQQPDRIIEDIFALAKDVATVLVYDFEIRLEEVVQRLFGQALPDSDYDHQKNFAGVSKGNLREVMRHEERLYFSASAEELAHLFLSVKPWRDTWLSGESHASLTQRLMLHTPHTRGLLAADTYLTRYAI